jgi:hypothetical protein
MPAETKDESNEAKVSESEYEWALDKLFEREGAGNLVKTTDAATPSSPSLTTPRAEDGTFERIKSEISELGSKFVDMGREVVDTATHVVQDLTSDDTPAEETAKTEMPEEMPKEDEDKPIITLPKVTMPTVTMPSVNLEKISQGFVGVGTEIKAAGEVLVNDAKAAAAAVTSWLTPRDSEDEEDDILLDSDEEGKETEGTKTKEGDTHKGEVEPKETVPEADRGIFGNYRLWMF